MPIRNYSDDAQFNSASLSKVFQGKPNSSEGEEGEERWCWIYGEGLFLAKKYTGEWRFFSSSTELLEPGVISSQSTASGGGSGISSGIGQFTALTVSSDTALSGVTGIAGSLSVTATTLTSFPTTANLKITSSKLDTVQDMQITSSPQFNGLGIGTAPSGEAGNIEVSSILGVSAPTFINNALFVYNTNYTNTSGTNLTDGLGLSAMTQAEATQLKNINSSTISSDQWGYVGNMNQNVATTSNVQLNQLTLKEGSSLGWVFNPDSNSNLVLEPQNNNKSIKFGSSTIDNVKLQSNGYVSGLFSGDGWSIFEEGNRHKMEVDDLSVRGTLSVYELLIQQVRATNGSLFVTSACKLIDGSAVTHVSGSSPNEYVLSFETDSDNTKPHPFANGDLILARRVEINGTNNDVVAQIKFTVTDITHGNSSQLKATNYEWTGVGTLQVAGKISEGADGFDFVRVGNITDSNRQGGIYLTSDDTLSPFIDIFNEVSGWEQWDGITSAFDFNNGSFDGLTSSHNATSWATVTNSSWEHKGSSGGAVSFPTTGGTTNDNYAYLETNGGFSYLRQNITFPTITSGSITAKISWYAKGNNGGRVALQEVSGSNFVDYFNGSGTYTNASSGTTIDFISMSTISSPSSQPTLNTSVWQKYEWDVVIPHGISADTDYYLVYAPNAAGGQTLSLNNVRISLPNKVKTRIGNIEGVGASGYGLWGENVWLSGRINASSGYIGDELQGWQIDSTGLKNASNSSYISSGQTTTGIDNGGIFLGGSGTFSAGASGTNGIKWDGSALTVRGAIHVTSAGSIDNSLVPNTGENIKLVAGGYNANGANVGVFKVDTDGTITNQVGGSPTMSTTGVTIMVWNPATNSLDTDFNTDGVFYNSDENQCHTQFSGIANGKIVAMLVHSNAYLTLNEASASEVTNIINDIKLIGGTTSVMNQTTVYGSYMCIGIKKASAHTSGTEFAGTLAEDRTISLTVNLKDNIINILDSEGPLTDYDADGESKFIFSREDGFQMANIDLNSAYYRSYLNFIMPNINPEDASNVYLFFKSRNLTDEGNTDVRLYLNGTHMDALTSTDIQDDDGTNQYVHEFHNIPSQLFKTDIGETNSFQFMLNTNGTSDPMYIYHFELRSSTTGQTYSSGEIASPEGNQFLNPGFEKDDNGSTSITNWSASPQTGASFQIVDDNQMTGINSLKFTNPSSISTSSYFCQNVKMLASKTYVLRFKVKWKYAITDFPTISIHSPNIDGSNSIGSLNIDANSNQEWSTTKQWMSWAEIMPNITDASLVGQWSNVELKFTTPSSIGSATLLSAHANNWKIWFYTGAQNQQEIWHDHLQFFEVSEVSPETTGLYMTGDRMGFYNGTGGFNGWSSLIKDDGTFFFGSPYEPANLISPSSGGPYVRFTGNALEVNANMVAGVIQSENLTATTGTKINLTDGSMITKGTNTSTGFVLDASGNLELNGATLDGGTITGQLFQTNYAEGDVNFVTSFIGSSTSAYRDVSVNSVNRLKCNRVCDSINMLFSLGEQGSGSYHTKLLGIWRYNDGQPPSGDNDTALNRVAGPSASTKITANMNAFPFLNFSWFTKNGEQTDKECFAMRFRIEGTAYHFYFRGGVRVDDAGAGDGGEVHMGYMGITSSEWTHLISQSAGYDAHPNNWGVESSQSWVYNIFDRDGDGGADESDYFDANTIEITCGTYTIILFGEAKHEQDGTTNQMTCTIKAFLTGTGTSMNDGSSTLTRVGVDLKKLNNGNYITDRNVHFPEGFFRVYN
tara:strand:- start:881 stop:6157 length:5277 start_codon:yes stop_codon:yes gene_type:complete